MNPPSNAKSIPPGQRMFWLVRRELWESRSIYIAPLAVAALILIGFLISAVHLPAKMRAASSLGPVERHNLIVAPYDFAAGVIMATTFFVALFYCLDALHGERRDRSILFWKSLPVSDIETVLSKAAIAIVVLPLLTFAITVATQWMMLLISSTVLLASGGNVTALWNALAPLPMWLMLLHHLLLIHGLWFTPLYAWLLLVSGWARRGAILWATLPLLAIGVVEKIAFNTSHLLALLEQWTGGGQQGGAYMMSSMSMLNQVTLARFLISPGLWIDLAIAAVLFASAAHVRRERGPI